MEPHWDDIRLFLAVARGGTLTAAGALTRLDPATLGRRIARLEESMDAALFVKSPQGYTLTAAGQEMRARAERAEDAMRAATGALHSDEAPGQLQGQIRIGAPDGCANYLLPQVCAALGAAHPGLDIQIVALPRVFNLSQREADMAIGVSAPNAGRLTVQKIAPYALHFAASSDYLRGAPPLRDLADLSQHRIVGYVPDMIFDKELDYLAAAGVQRVALASNSVAVQLNLLAQGGGVGIVHDFALPAAPGLRRVLRPVLSLERNFYLIRHQVDAPQPMQSRFAALLIQQMRAELARLEGLAASR